jgi:hypothetical protein
MKRLYAEQINKMLEDYYFNLENNPQGRDSHYGVLAQRDPAYLWCRVLPE